MAKAAVNAAVDGTHSYTVPSGKYAIVSFFYNGTITANISVNSKIIATISSSTPGLGVAHPIVMNAGDVVTSNGCGMSGFLYDV